MPTKCHADQYFDETYRWQVDYALSILGQPDAYRMWSSCYLGTWPMLIFGYAVTSDRDITLIREVLSCTVQRMGFGENQRLLNELEGIWSARGNGAHSPEDCAMR